MPNVTITNNLSTPYFANFLYTQISPGDSVTFYRTATDLMAQKSLHEDATNGYITLLIEYTPEEKESSFDIFPGLSLPDTEAGNNVASENVRYANANANEGGDGSLLNPYNKIQDAIDELESIGGFSQLNPAAIYVEPGRYSEALVFTQPGIHLSAKVRESRSFSSVYIRPSGDSAWPLTITNATRESLAAYDISGNYSDLVNNGSAGPQYNIIEGFTFRGGYTGSIGSVRMLGVKGDVSATTTAFGDYVTFSTCTIRGQSNTIPGLYCRNCGEIQFFSCFMPYLAKYDNCWRTSYFHSFSSAHQSFYNSSDPNGKHQYAAWAQFFYYETQVLANGADIIIDGGGNGSAYVDAHYSHLGLFADRFGAPTENLIVRNVVGGNCFIDNCGGKINLDIDGDVDTDIRSSLIYGDVSIGSGPGTAKWNGGGWTGELTDPDDKLSLTTTKRYIYPATITSTTTARISEKIRYDTSGGTFTLSAPPSPVVGDSFGVKEIVGNATDITVAGNGNNIEHPFTGVVATNAVFGRARIGVTWEYDGSNWIIPITKTIQGDLTIMHDPTIDGISRRLTGSATTVGVTTEVLVSIPLEDDGVYEIKYTVVGKEVGNGDRAAYVRIVNAHRYGGTPAIGTTAFIHTDETDPPWTSFTALNGNNLEIKALGGAGSTIKWFCEVFYVMVKA